MSFRDEDIGGEWKGYRFSICYTPLPLENFERRMMTNEIEISNENSTRSNRGFLQARTFDEAWNMAVKVSKSGLVPSALKDKPNDIVLILQMAQELQLEPTFALRNIASINGKTALYGDGLLAVCRKCRDWVDMKETYDIKTETATCILSRKGEEDSVVTFSKQDAITAKLWGKAGPWTTTPKRMLQMRARGFALRDKYADILAGFITEDEAEDYPREKLNYGGISKSMKQANGETVDDSIESISDQQLLTLRDLIEAAESNEETIAGFYKVSCLDELTVAQYDFTRVRLEQTIAKKKQSEELPINQILDADKLEGTRLK
jgi:hypothetical protein